MLFWAEKVNGSVALLRNLTLTLGLILTVYSSVGVLSETILKDHEQVNRVLCQFLLCNSAPLIARARDQLTPENDDNVQQAVTTFRTVLQQDSQDPYRWADLGDAFLEAGRKEDARYCFRQVSELAPRTAVLLLRVADFHFQIGENQEALSITARILGLIQDYDSLIFSDYLSHVDTDAVLRLGLPEGSRAARSWLRFLIKAGRLNDAQQTWDWITEHGYPDDALAGEYTEFVINQRRPELAASAWRQYAGARTPGYDESTYIFNGDFESDPAQSPFDWNFAQEVGLKIGRDAAIAASGKNSLRIDFDGTQNPDIAVAWQLAYVHPGYYHFHGSYAHSSTCYCLCCYTQTTLADERDVNFMYVFVRIV